MCGVMKHEFNKNNYLVYWLV